MDARGERFLLVANPSAVQPSNESSSRLLTVTVNWLSGLQKQDGPGCGPPGRSHHRLLRR
jgi:hypothetical protein